MNETTHDPEKIHFRSVPRSRLYVGILFVVLGFILLLEFGVSFGRDAIKGSWLVLGGPSFFYPLGAIPVLIGIGLLLYSFFARVEITIAEISDGWEVTEKKIYRVSTTHVPREDIARITFNSTHLGPKLLWIPVLMVYVILTITEGASLVTNPTSFNYGIEVGIAYLVSGSVVACGMVVLVAIRPYFLEFMTRDQLLELQFFPPKNENTINNVVTYLAGTEISDYQPVSANREPKNSSVSHFHPDYQRIIVGIILIGVGVLSRVLLGGAGEFTRWIAFIYGVVLVIKGVAEDLPRPDKGLQEMDGKGSWQILFQSHFSRYFSWTRVNSPDKPKGEYILPTLDAFDALGIELGFTFSWWSLVTLLLYLPPRSPDAIGMIFASVGSTIIVTFLLAWLLLAPKRVFQWDHYTSRSFTESLRGWRRRFSIGWRVNHRTFSVRVFYALLGVFVGIIISLYL